jgi:hypothetical protein
MAPERSPITPAIAPAGERLAPAVGGQDAGRIGAGTEEGRLAERHDARIAEHQVDREREDDDGEDLRAQRQIVGKSEIGRGRHDPGQCLEQVQAVPPPEGIENGACVGHQAAPKMPRGRHSSSPMVSA